jgi:type IV secretory pathway TraG/TraD family ATPase VirD4
VVVASTKGHVIDETIGWRSRQGEVHVYDPAAITPYYRSGWSLLAECATWQGAIRTAADLTLAARGAGVSDGPERAIGDGQGDLWRSSMSMALAPFLLAAVSSGQTVSVAAEWIEREERDEVLTILQGVDRMAARTHASTFMREDASRSAFLHAMHQVLRVYDDPAVASSMDLHEIVPEELLDGGANSLYLTTPEHDQARFRPLCSMIVRRLIATAYQQSANSGAALGSPLLVVLDDVLGIAPIYDLASLASTAPARGVQLVSVFQDTDQIITRYGENADNVIRNHGAKLVLAGRPAGRPFAADLVATELTDQLGAWEAALLYGSARPARVRLRPWFRDRELKRRVQTPQDVVKPAEGSASRESRPSSDQASVWLRRGPVRPPEGTDPTIPLDRHAPGYVEVFGSLDDDTAPQNVTPMPGSHWRGGGS